MAKKAGNPQYITLLTLLVVGLAKLSTAKVCLVSYNSTSPSGYFQFDVWFPTKKAPKYAGEIGTQPPAACGVLCAKSPFGFYTHLTQYGTVTLCYCLRSNPDYTKAEIIYTNSAYYAKKCPSVKRRPAPPSPPPIKRPPPPSPPPPFVPKDCYVPYNSSKPTGYFHLTYFNPTSGGGPPFLVNATDGVSVWPEVGSTLRCQKVCKNYKWGFYVNYNKYSDDAQCFCFRSRMTYEPGGGGYWNEYYSKSCPNGKGHHPPGVGHHPPGH